MDIENTLHWPAAPGWAIFAGNAGKTLILIAIALFLLATALAFDRSGKRSKLLRLSFLTGCACVVGSIVCLGSLFAGDQFEWESVRASSEHALSIQLKISAIWAHQEGSFLLWASTSAIFAGLASMGAGKYLRGFVASSSIFLASLCAILAYESPFQLTLTHGKALVPPDGAGLVPSLQNYWVVIHPPTIFSGFGSLTVLAAYATAALLAGDLKSWIAQVRPWAIVSATLLGLGLCMGGFWAYETLNWGGFWAWDPVENVSFVPWILSVAFVHGIIVQAAGRNWVRTNVILGALPFFFFLYGTYLTRSGIYADLSNHSFVRMESRAEVILLSATVVGVLAFAGLFAWRARTAGRTPEAQQATGVDRASLYRWGVLMLGFIGIATAIGMSVPLFELIAKHQPKIAEAHLYHVVLAAPYLVVMLLIALTPFAGWRGEPIKPLLARVANAASFSVLLTGVTVFLIRSHAGLDGGESVELLGNAKLPLVPILALLLFVCYFAVLANLLRVFQSLRRSPMSIGGFVSHVGVATLFAGMIFSVGLERKDVGDIQEGAPQRVLGATVAFEKFTSDDVTSKENQAVFQVQEGSNTFEAKPTLYFTRDPGTGEIRPIATPHIERRLSHDLYFAVGNPQFDVWPDPVSIKPGENATFNHVTIDYDRFTMEGSPGKVGVKFGAELRIKTDRGTFKAHPTLQLTDNGLAPSLTPIDGDLLVTLQGIEPGSQAGKFQIHYSKPIYPVELYYKPMTGLVWAGAGILTLGGALSAFYRRKGKKTPSKSAENSDGPEIYAA